MTNGSQHLVLETIEHTARQKEGLSEEYWNNLELYRKALDRTLSCTYNPLIQEAQESVWHQNPL